jgi:hypothetical protein
MARKLLFKQSGLDNTNSTPIGYKFLGDSSGQFSQKEGSTITPISGSSSANGWSLIKTVTYTDINSQEGQTEFIAGTFSFSSGLVEAVAIKYTQLLDVDSGAAFQVENVEGQSLSPIIATRLEQIGTSHLPLTGYQISDYNVIFRAGQDANPPFSPLTFSSTNTQGEFEIWSKISVL